MSEKVKAILGYLITIAALIFLILPETEKKTKFHCAQALVMDVIAYVLYFILKIIGGMLSSIRSPGFAIISIILSLGVVAFVLIFAVMGIVKAANDEEPELPFIGNLTKSIFGKMIGE